jgi:AraC-like DNA-binding protein
MKTERVNFYKYFPVSEQDTKWGVFIENVGMSDVLKSEQYPLTGHPDTHYFTWDKGRYLSSYQLLLIAEGQGIFESESAGIVTLYPGSVMLLFPNEWHRYMPFKKTGWREYWIGFHGDLTQRLINGSVFNKSQPIFHIRTFQEIQNLFEVAVNYSKEEKPGFQQIVVGILFQIFGLVYYNIKNKTRYSQSFITQINHAKEMMQDKVNDDMDIPKIAIELNIGYALFRKKFKEFTGMSPKQYHLQIKLNRAKTLLLSSDLPVKLIAFETGFESIFHFSKAFKEKTGSSPTQFREIVKESGRNGNL